MRGNDDRCECEDAKEEDQAGREIGRLAGDCVQRGKHRGSLSMRRNNL